MASDVTETRGKMDQDARITLNLLDAVDGGEASQRSLAARLGIALGLTNAYLKRCVRTGLVKVKQAPANRYVYYLTPRGFTEKSRLTAQYLARSFRFYRQAREEVGEIFAKAAAAGRRRVALSGAGELAEIALICALEHDIEIAGLIDPGSNLPRFMNVPRAQDPAALAFDLVLVTSVKHPQDSYEVLVGTVEEERIVAPPLLRILRRTMMAEPARAEAAS
ncbi:MAG: winged helix-turn-helix transcriptional regulator [Alphaproteobacteria bacterium]|nr:winged helix-turn-helix transcriptional regulator [Alphaproteobacteria bacterium]